METVTKIMIKMRSLSTDGAILILVIIHIAKGQGTICFPGGSHRRPAVSYLLPVPQPLDHCATA